MLSDQNEAKRFSKGRLVALLVIGAVVVCGIVALSHAHSTDENVLEHKVAVTNEHDALVGDEGQNVANSDASVATESDGKRARYRYGIPPPPKRGERCRKGGRTVCKPKKCLKYAPCKKNKKYGYKKPAPKPRCVKYSRPCYRITPCCTIRYSKPYPIYVGGKVLEDEEEEVAQDACSRRRVCGRAFCVRYTYKLVKKYLCDKRCKYVKKGGKYPSGMCKWHIVRVRNRCIKRKRICRNKRTCCLRRGILISKGYSRKVTV